MSGQLQWQRVGDMDTWQAKHGSVRYQIRRTGTPQHGPWRLQVWYPSQSEPARVNRLQDRAQAERIANNDVQARTFCDHSQWCVCDNCLGIDNGAGTAGLEPARDGLTGRCSAN